MNYLAPAGEAGAKLRVRDLSAWRSSWAPGIKILMKIAPHPNLSPPFPLPYTLEER